MNNVGRSVFFVVAAGVSVLADFNPAEIAKRTLPAVVSIRVKTTTGEAGGSGFIVDPSGTIVTNLHVITGATSAAVKLSTGDVYDEVQILSFDERKDLAVIQIAAFGLPTVPLGDSDKVAPGQRVVVVGNPLGVLEGSVSTGVVSGIRTLDGYKVLQTDATANHGNSGGPMLDESGAVVGVVTFKLAEGKADNLNFAIPINYARGMLASQAQRLSLADMQRSIGKTPDLFAITQVSLFPKRWKSLSSGSVKSLRVDSEYVYVETVQTAERSQRGNFVLSELKKSGGRYIGITRAAIVGSYVRFGQERFQRCTFEDPIEITLLTPTRLEGAAAGWEQLDFGNCSRKGLRPHPFVWIPE